MLCILSAYLVFIDMETERRDSGPHTEVGVVQTGIETPEVEWNGDKMC